MLDDGATCDFLIIGSGAGSVCAALVAARAGFSTMILEKQPQFGGSSALSGGVMWIPDNPVMKRAGLDDCPADGLTYLNACAGDPVPGSTLEKRAAFIDTGPKAISFLESCGMEFSAAKTYPDYHEGEYPGAVPGGRSIIAPNFDLRELGPHADMLLRPDPKLDAPVSIPEISALSICGRTGLSKLTYLHVAWRTLRKFLGARLVGMGGAMQGRLLQLALRANIPIYTDAAVTELTCEGGRVTGVVAQYCGKEIRIRARKGVLLDCGGFARNARMRAAHQPAPHSVDWSYANVGDTGEMIEAAVGLGAATNGMDLSIWVTSTLLADDDKPAFAIFDMSKPHAILIDSSGQRYVNESTSYVRVGLAMYERHKQTAAIPSWIVFDSQHRRKYLFAGKMPGKVPQDWIESGQIIEAATIDDLAQKCGIAPDRLTTTITQFNNFAASGVDEDFNRGHSRYDQFFGDPINLPNANLGTLSKPPFYAARAYPGDVGTMGGVVTDEAGRVLSEQGQPIDGLYAAGNAAAPVFGASYPGAGASIGAALVFSFIAARHALGINT